jgi:hypothetical protein
MIPTVIQQKIFVPNYIHLWEYHQSHHFHILKFKIACDRMFICFSFWEKECKQQKTKGKVSHSFLSQWLLHFPHKYHNNVHTNSFSFIPLHIHAIHNIFMSEEPLIFQYFWPNRNNLEWVKKQIWGCIQNFPDWVNNKIYAYLWYYSLRSNTKGYSSRTH